MTVTAHAMSTIELRRIVDERLRAFFDEHAGSAGPAGTTFSRLWSSIARSSGGGKRIRPTLVLRAHSAFGGDSPDDAVTVATAFELLHTAFLLHDDVIDGDLMRRGRPNLIGEFVEDARRRGVPDQSAREWGRAAAILGGDILIHSAQAMVARAGVGHTRRIALLDVMEQSVFVTAAGELDDVAFSTGAAVASQADVLAMTRAKTAHYSFQAPLQAGAILAGAADDDVAMLGRFGRSVGVAFQLQDDLLGVFGASEMTGKSTRSDLQNAKSTCLMTYALQTDARAELLAATGAAELSEGDLRRIRALLTDCGARSFVERLIDGFVSDAIATIADHPLPGHLGEYLCEVAECAGHRVS